MILKLLIVLAVSYASQETKEEEPRVMTQSQNRRPGFEGKFPRGFFLNPLPGGFFLNPLPDLTHTAEEKPSNNTLKGPKPDSIR